MTTTDRAFIAALQQSAARHAPSTAADTAAEPASVTMPTSANGPHFPSEPRVEARRAPLSEHLARRREAERPATLPLRPGFGLQAFDWPAVADRLAGAARTQLLDLLSAATEAGNPSATPAVAFVGLKAGVGATTALLATALLVEGVGGKVGILDISPDSGVATHLGVWPTPPPRGRFDASLIDDLLVTSRSGNTSLIALGPGPEGALLRLAGERLAATHDLLLIDAGDVHSAARLRVEDAGSPLVILLDTSGGQDSERLHSAAQLARAGVKLLGLVETLADRC